MINKGRELKALEFKPQVKKRQPLVAFNPTQEDMEMWYTLYAENQFLFLWAWPSIVRRWCLKRSKRNES